MLPEVSLCGAIGPAEGSRGPVLLLTNSRGAAELPLGPLRGREQRAAGVLVAVFVCPFSHLQSLNESSSFSELVAQVNEI